MRDQIDSSLWSEHHEGWSEFVDDVIGGIPKVLRRIYEIEFDAPWRHLPKQEH